MPSRERTKLQYWIKLSGQKKLSICEELDIKMSTFSGYVTGERGVDRSILPKLAEILNRTLEPKGYHVEPDDLINGLTGEAGRPKKPIDKPAPASKFHPGEIPVDFVKGKPVPVAGIPGGSARETSTIEAPVQPPPKRKPKKKPKRK